MTETVHNPDRLMADLRTIIAQGRKRIAFLLGAGAPASMPHSSGAGALIPTISSLTSAVTAALSPQYSSVLSAIAMETGTANIESILSRARSLSAVIGNVQVHGLDGDGYRVLCEKIGLEISKIVNVSLPSGPNPYRHLVSWIIGADREHPVELFTTNYDLLFEEAFEDVRAPLFDGFTGAREPFFDAVSVANNDLPSRWTRLWKLHGSVGWRGNAQGEVVRPGGADSGAHLIYPEHMKYDQTRKAPYSALFDRLRAFLGTPDTLLVTSGFSFADAHVAAVIDEALSANPATSVLAFQYGELIDEQHAARLGRKRPNFSAYCSDRAIVSGVEGRWRLGEPLSKDWAAIRASYWSSENSGRLLLGNFAELAKFFALARSEQALDGIVQQ